MFCKLQLSIGLYIWQCNLHPTDVKLIVPDDSFWRQVLPTWCEFNYEMLTTPESCLGLTLWYNSNIRIQGQPFFFKQSYQNVLMLVKDIIHE